MINYFPKRSNLRFSAGNYEYFQFHGTAMNIGAFNLSIVSIVLDRARTSLSRESLAHQMAAVYTFLLHRQPLDMSKRAL